MTVRELRQLIENVDDSLEVAIFSNNDIHVRDANGVKVSAIRQKLIISE